MPKWRGFASMRPEAPSSAEPARPAPALERRLSTLDGVLLTVGGVVGTGIFFTTADMARALPEAPSILLAWLAAGLLTLAGALTYAELGTMFPQAGGLYCFLREAYGPLPAFLYGWTAFTVIMSGGIAAIAAGFGDYLGSFVPWCSAAHELWRVPLGEMVWSVSGAQVTGAVAIVLLTALNAVGVEAGTRVQNGLTLVKAAAIVAFAVVGFGVAAPPAVAAMEAPVATMGWWSAFGVCMVAALWAYDGWYGLTFAAGELRDPARSLPRALVLGTLVVIVLYLLVNLAYCRALSPAQMAATTRVGETAAVALFGTAGAQWVAAAVLVATFGCLSATILYSARIYLPMAHEGLFFRALGNVHPRWRTPRNSLVAQSAWAVALVLSGRFDQLTTYVVFAGVLFHIAAGAAVFVLRRRRPEMPRPYRVQGYPVVPLLFLVATVALLFNTLSERPGEAAAGLLCVATGLPAYWFWRRAARRGSPAGSGMT